MMLCNILVLLLAWPRLVFTASLRTRQDACGDLKSLLPRSTVLSSDSTFHNLSTENWYEQIVERQTWKHADDNLI